MITGLIKKNSRLYRFMMSRKTLKSRVAFDEDIWKEAMALLSELNNPDYYFDFEDRLIEEITVSVLKHPPHKAKEEIARIHSIVFSGEAEKLHSRPFLRSIKNSVSGAVAVALRCL